MHPANPGTGSRVTEHIVFFPRERRCSIINSGADKDAFVWIEDIKGSLQARHLNPVEETLFILDHLGGLMKREV